MSVPPDVDDNDHEPEQTDDSFDPADLVDRLTDPQWLVDAARETLGLDEAEPEPEPEPEAEPEAEAEPDPAAAEPEPEVEHEPIGPTVADFLIGALDGTLRAIARRPVRLRFRTSPVSALQGKVDVVVIELRELPVTGLVVERMVIHAENLRVEPGLPPRLKAGPVGFKATVGQKSVDRWTKAAHLPVRLKLTSEGIVTKTSVIGGVSMEVTTELAARGPFLRLMPRSASMLGVRSPIVPPLPGYLPLPPLPAGAKLTRVEHGDGEVTVWFDAGEVDEPITPALARRLTRRFLLPMPLLG